MAHVISVTQAPDDALVAFYYPDKVAFVQFHYSDGIYVISIRFLGIVTG
jgi:hypothetical protein